MASKGLEGSDLNKIFNIFCFRFLCILQTLYLNPNQLNLNFFHLCQFFLPELLW